MLYNIFKKLVCLASLVCFLILAVTGFYPMIIQGAHLGGYSLMIHVTIGAVFAVTLAISALIWAERNCFQQADWPWGFRITHQQQKSTDEKLMPAYSFVRKKCFWVIMFLALPVILSVVLSMLPLFGTCGQHILLQLHRCSTSIFALVAIIYICLTIKAK
jgi:cytochrome b subunit of formate dehydrogenase